MRIEPREYVRVGTAAKIAGVTRAYLRRLIHDDKLPAVEVDGMFLVRRRDAEKLRDRREAAGRNDPSAE